MPKNPSTMFLPSVAAPILPSNRSIVAIDSSLLPKRRTQKFKQDAGAASSALTELEATPRHNSRNNVPPGHDPPSNVESDGEGSQSLLASFQRRPDDKAKGESPRPNPIEASVTSSLRNQSGNSKPHARPGIDTYSPIVPKPKRRKKYNPEAGSRCDRCIMQRRGCDGKRPVCGRCADLGKECEWHDEQISRTELEKLSRRKLDDGEARPRNSVHDESRAKYTIANSRPRQGSQDIGKDTGQKRRDTTPNIQSKGLKESKEDSVKPARQTHPPLDQDSPPAIFDIEPAPQQDRDPWTYKDHLSMLKTISKVRINPLTKEQMLGHKKGNKIFDNTTKAFAEFNNLEDPDVNVAPLGKYEGLQLNWEEREGTHRALPNPAWGTMEPSLVSNLRERIGLRERPIPSVDGPQPTDQRSRGMPMQLYRPEYMQPARIGEDHLCWMESWMEEPREHAVDWDDGGRLPRPKGAADFSWYAGC